MTQEPEDRRSDEEMGRCGGTGMVAYWDGSAYAGEMCRGCIDCEGPDEAALGTAGAPAPPARLMALARIGAAILHNYYFDRAENIDDDPPAGHVNDGTGQRGTRNMFGFDTCPHPDCVLVRESAALAASPGPVQPPEK